MCAIVLACMLYTYNFRSHVAHLIKIRKWGCGYVGVAMVAEAIFEKLKPMYIATCSLLHDVMSIL